jgi:hypothetical protein
VTTPDSRFRFPEDRTAFVYQGTNQPILTPPRTALQLYADEHATALADVLWLDGSSIEFSTVYTGDDGLVPEFYGPLGAARVWVRVIGSGQPLYPLVAQYSELLANRPELETSSGRPDNAVGVPGAWCIDPIDHVLYGPKTEAGWPTQGIALAAPPGEGGRQSYTHNQQTASDEWVMDHPLAFEPSVTILDSFNEEVEGDISYPLASRVVARFTAPFSGRAVMS